MTVNLTADEYHTLRSRERDHLMAAAIHAAKHDAIPSTRGLSETVGRLTGGTVSYETTQAALDGLAEAGLVERRDGEPTPNARGVAVTSKGQRVLAYGAARLDAAATVGNDVATTLANATGRDRDVFSADDKDVPDLDDLESVE